MRGFLSGTTALVTLAALMHPRAASADEPLKLTIGGRYLAAFGGTLGEDENQPPTAPLRHNGGTTL